MARFLITRFAGLIFVLLATSFVTFAIMYNVPGGPFDETEQPLSPEAKANIIRKYGLDKPFYEQWARYLWNAAQGDFGYSYQRPKERVLDIFAKYWGTSLLLGALTIAWSFPTGIILGIVAALKRNTWIDSIVTVLALISVTLPTISIIFFGLLLFSVQLKWLPYTGWKPLEDPRTLILPVFIFGVNTVGSLARYVRSGMLDVLGQDYIRTARAKGLPRAMVIFKHAMRNMMIPIVTLFGPVVANVITGSALIEIGFVIPGIGRYYLDSIYARDYPVLMAIVIIGTVALTLTYFITDILYTVLDPRIRITKAR